MQTTPRRGPAGSRSPVRSVRVSNEVWNRAKRRAAHEGVTMSAVMGTIVEGWSEGEIDLPTTRRIYKQPKSA